MALNNINANNPSILIALNKQRLAVSNDVQKKLIDNEVEQNKQDVKSFDDKDKKNAELAQADIKNIQKKVETTPMTNDEMKQQTAKLIDDENRRRLGLLSASNKA